MDYENVKEGIEHHCELWLAQCEAKWWKEQHDLMLKNMVEMKKSEEGTVLRRYGMDKTPERWPVLVVTEAKGHADVCRAYNLNGFNSIKDSPNCVCWVYEDKALFALPSDPDN